MPRTEYTKERLLELMKILQQETDENHRLSTPQLISMLEDRGIPTERKTIYRDIELLGNFGLDIDSNRKGHCILSGEFELAELKLLADAVQCSRFITEKKSFILLAKLEKLTSRHNAVQLRRQLHMIGRAKTDNESIYYNVDALYDAIAKNSQITFRYLEYKSDGTRVRRDKLYQASPFGLCWDNENYYLVAYTEERGRTHYRVDRMTDIRLLNIPRLETEKYADLNMADYSKQVFGMFGGDPVSVVLEFPDALADSAIDRFGRDVMMVPQGNGRFHLTATIAVSPVFFSWVFSFNGRVRILQPSSVREEYLQMCRNTIENL